jgi:3-methyladenine DNA glycosylase AlkD
LVKIIDKYAPLTTLSEIAVLLQNPVHEVRTCAVAILVRKMKTKDSVIRKTVFDFYIAHLEQCNGWDLVDISAPDIVGEMILETGNDAFLDQLVVSENLWRRRVSIVATWRLIRNNRLDATYRIVGKLLDDQEDLIHKACGWMLREAGKKDRRRLNRFLKENYAKLPRTTLRYAIERHEEAVRKEILKGNFREELMV